MWWMKLMLPLTSKMSPLWDIISRYVIGSKKEKGQVDRTADISQIYLQNFITTWFFVVVLSTLED